MEQPKPKQTRIRKRSLEVQLQQCLNDAEAATGADISTQKLVQTRLNCLLKMQARAKSDNKKLATALAEVTRLTAEVERLTQALAQAQTKPTVASSGESLDAKLKAIDEEYALQEGTNNRLRTEEKNGTN